MYLVSLHGSLNSLLISFQHTVTLMCTILLIYHIYMHACTKLQGKKCKFHIHSKNSYFHVKPNLLSDLISCSTTNSFAVTIGEQRAEN